MSIISDFIEATIAPIRRIANFDTYVTIEEIASDDLEITQHPVQQGATITDHAYIKPSQLSIKVVFSNRTAPLEEIYKNFLDLQQSRIPFDVITGKRIYTNMLIKSLSQTNDVQTENMLSINMQLQEIIITNIELTSVPPREQQKNPGKTGQTEKAGTKNAAVVSEPKRRSALATLAG